MPTTTKPKGPRTRPSPPPPPVEDDTFDELLDIDKKQRTPKMEKLEGAVAGLYMMMGGAVSTLPEQVAGQKIKAIGISIAQSSEEIAAAWVDLAEDDKKVLKTLESLTSFSGWGKVAGVHLMAIGTIAVPGVMGAMPIPPVQQQQQSQGSLDPQVQMVMAEMFRRAESQRRAEAAPVFDEPEQVRQPLRQPRQGQQVRRGGATRPGRNAGIPSAADLGVTIPDAAVEFPVSGSDNLNG